MALMEASSWEMMTTVIPRFRERDLMRASREAEVMGSRPAEGSSRKRILGSRAMARAIAARLTWPPESSAGKASARSRRSTWVSLRRAMARRRGSGKGVNSSRGRRMFSRTVRLPKRAPLWYIMPKVRRRRSRSGPSAVAMSWPRMRMVPPRVGSWPMMCLRSVDLPQPEPPRMKTTSPSEMVRETSRMRGLPG